MERRNFAVAILVNEKNEVLLQKKTKDYKDFPNHWAFFGGGIHDKEKPEQALKRELLEELEYEIDEIRLFKIIDYQTAVKEGKGYYFISIFKGKLEDLKIKEGAGFAFFSKEEINSLKLNPMDTLVLKEFLKNEM